MIFFFNIYQGHLHLKFRSESPTGFTILIWAIADFAELFTEKLPCLSSCSPNSHWPRIFLWTNPRHSFNYAALRWWLLELMLNSHRNAKEEPRKLKRIFVLKLLPSWKNADDILPEQKNLRKVWAWRYNTKLFSIISPSSECLQVTSLSHSITLIRSFYYDLCDVLRQQRY